MEFYGMLRNKSTMNFEYIQVSIIIIFYITTGVYTHNYLVSNLCELSYLCLTITIVIINMIRAIPPTQPPMIAAR